MKSGSWRRAVELFEAAIELPPGERERFVTTRSAGDTELREAVQRMLGGHDQEGILDHPMSGGSELLFGAFAALKVFTAGEIVSQRFEIVRFIGQGGMGEVYEAIDRELREHIAIKTVRREFLDDSAVVDRFKREVNRARKVTHPNVCRIYDLFNHAVPGETETPFMTMELLEGVTLSEHLAARENKRLKAGEFHAITRQVCAGIEAAHLAGVLHRDLKSGNVVVLPQESRRVAITDFGLAHSSSGKDVTTMAFGGGHLAGTLDYMAPELLVGGAASTASDIYSLGVLMYEAATGVLPFRADSPLLAATLRLARDPAPPRSIVPELPRPYEYAILRCLDRDPAGRPATPAEVMRLMAGAPIWSRIPIRPFAPASRRVLLVAGAMAAGAGLVYWLMDRRTAVLDPASGNLVLLGGIESADVEAAQALRFLLATALADSAELRTVADGRLRRTLALMQTDSQEPPLGDLARRAAIREGAGLVVTGKLDAVASGYRMNLRVTAPGTPGYERQFDETSGAPEQFAAAATRLVRRLLVEIRGSGGAAVRDVPALEKVTTSSLEALQLFSRAFQLYNKGGEYDRARDLLRAARRIDPEFAMTYEYEALIWAAQGREDMALEPSARAFQLRERTSNRERLQIEAVYHACRGDYEGSLEAFRALDAEYPGDAGFQRHLAHSYCVVGRPAEAIRWAKAASEADGTVVNWSSLAFALAEAGRPAEALAAIETARKNPDATPVLKWGEGLAELASERLDPAAAAFTALSEVEGYTRFGRLQVSKCRILQGRLTLAMEQLESDLALDIAKRDSANEAHRRWWLSHLYTLTGDSKSALAHIRALVARPAEPSQMTALQYGAFGAWEQRAPDLVQAAVHKLGQIQANHPSTRSQGIFELASGWLADLVRDPRASRSKLGRANSLWPDLISSYALGLSSLESGDFALAESRFSEVVQRKGSALRWETPILWLLAHHHLARAKAAQGDRTGARAACDRFLKFWATAQPRLRVVIEAQNLKRKLNEE